MSNSSGEDTGQSEWGETMSNSPAKGPIELLQSAWGRLVNSDDESDETERPWSAVWCLLFGHKEYPELTWELENNASARKMWGDLCRRCHRFQPREDGKVRFETTGADSKKYDEETR